MRQHAVLTLDEYETENAGEYVNRLVLKAYEGTGAEVIIPEGVGLYAIAKEWSPAPQ